MLWVILIIIVLIFLFSVINSKSKQAYHAERQRKNLAAWSEMQKMLPPRLQNRDTNSLSDDEINEISKILREKGIPKMRAYDIGRAILLKRDGDNSRWNDLFGKTEQLETKVQNEPEQKKNPKTSSYKSQNNMIEETTEDGIEIKRKYNSNDRLSEEIFPEGLVTWESPLSKEIVEKRIYEYDSKNNLVKVQEKGKDSFTKFDYSSKSYKYDDKNNLIEKTIYNYNMSGSTGKPREKSIYKIDYEEDKIVSVVEELYLPEPNEELELNREKKYNREDYLEQVKSEFTSTFR